MILHISTNKWPLMQQIVKYSLAINTMFEKNMNSDLYIEPIEDAILYIFRDFAAFERAHTPVPHIPDFIFKRMKITDMDERRILNDNLNRATFPPEGIIFYIRSKTHPLDRLHPLLERYYHSIHPEIKVPPPEGDHVKIIFSTYECSYRYFVLTYYTLQKIKKKEDSD